MSPVTQQGFIPSSVSVTISASQNTKISNLAMALADTEYSHALQGGLKQVIIKHRGNGKIKLAFTASESGTKFLTIPGLNTLELTGLDFTGKTLYMQSNIASSVVEILELY